MGCDHPSPSHPSAEAGHEAPPQLRAPGNVLVSRRCPIGHRVDIPYENWTRSLRTYSCYSSSNPESHRDLLTCDDASCLTRRHRAFVSNSCHFFRTPLSIPWRHIQSLRDADQPVRKVPSRDGYPRRSSRIVQRRWEMKDPAAQCMASPTGSPAYSIPSYLTLKI
jgi:hypothetical protein